MIDIFLSRLPDDECFQSPNQDTAGIYAAHDMVPVVNNINIM